MIFYIIILMLGLQTPYTHTKIYSLKHHLHSHTNHASPILALNTPPTFGKTHFIIGHPTNPIEYASLTPPAAQSQASIAQVFFTPDDNIRNELLRLIKQELEAIKIAIFVITDKEITQTLLDARERGIRIELVTDASCLKERAHKINQLCDRGCSVYIYNPSYCNQASSIMHHKFALFTNSAGKSLVWTGSYNFTKAASSYNQENALILEDQKTFELFSNQFRRLKERSYRYARTRNTAEV